MDHYLVSRGNNVLLHNPPVASNNITSRGSSWLWAVFAIMLLAAFAFIFLTIAHARKRGASPRFHYIAVAITLVSAFSYFVMASNLGSIAIAAYKIRGGKRPGPTREMFYARWIEYFITFPLEALAVAMLARTRWSTRVFVMGAAAAMIVCHLTGALVRNNYKWGFLVFGIIAYLLVAWRLMTAGNEDTGRHGHGDGLTGTHGTHGTHGTTGHHDAGVGEPGTTTGAGSNKKGKMLAMFLLGVWLLYPICWGVSEAGNVISLDGECIFYGILDLLTKPVFAAALIFYGIKGHQASGTHGHRGGVLGDHRKTSADTAGTHHTGSLGHHNNTAAV